MTNARFKDMVDLSIFIRILDPKLRLRTESNSSEDWRVKRRRSKAQKELVRGYLLKYAHPGQWLPAVVTFTRVAPRELDSHDNLSSSFKYVADEVAAFLAYGGKPGWWDAIKPGRGDAPTDGVTFRYQQEKSRVRVYGMRIEIERQQT